MIRTFSPWWLPGAVLVLFGLMIVIFPELLALLVASGFIMAGVSLLSVGWAARRFRQNNRGNIYYYDRNRSWL